MLIVRYCIHRPIMDWSSHELYDSNTEALASIDACTLFVLDIVIGHWSMFLWGLWYGSEENRLGWSFIDAYARQVENKIFSYKMAKFQDMDFILLGRHFGIFFTVICVPFWPVCPSLLPHHCSFLPYSLVVIKDKCHCKLIRCLVVNFINFPYFWCIKRN